jgi:hypothetical protein
MILRNVRSLLRQNPEDLDLNPHRHENLNPTKLRSVNDWDFSLHLFICTRKKSLE